jgi:hypothetical protein
MLRRIFSRSALIFLSFLFFPLFPRPLAPAAPPDDQETILTFVHDFLQLFYPELMIKGNMLKLSVNHPTDSSWREISGVYFTVTHTTLPDYRAQVLMPDGQLVPPTIERGGTRVLLDGNMWVPFPQQHGRIVEVVALDGIHSEKINALKKLVQANPQWTNEQAVDVLKQQGARFGPDDKEEFLNSLPLEKAEKFLGKLKLVSAEFYPIPDERDEHTSVRFDWHVEAEATFPDGTKGTYNLSFEPFEGKLLMISSFDH